MLGVFECFFHTYLYILHFLFRPFTYDISLKTILITWVYVRLFKIKFRLRFWIICRNIGDIPKYIHIVYRKHFHSKLAKNNGLLHTRRRENSNDVQNSRPQTSRQSARIHCQQKMTNIARKIFLNCYLCVTLVGF